MGDIERSLENVWPAIFTFVRLRMIYAANSLFLPGSDSGNSFSPRKYELPEVNTARRERERPKWIDKGGGEIMAAKEGWSCREWWPLLCFACACALLVDMFFFSFFFSFVCLD